MRKTTKKSRKSAEPAGKRAAAKRTRVVDSVKATPAPERKVTPAKKGSARAAAKKQQARPTQKKAGRNAAKSGRGERRLLEAYRGMLESRLLDAELVTLCEKGSTAFYASNAGHEAIQSAAGMVFRAGIDWSYPYYRDLTFALTLGMTLEEAALNAFSKNDDPNSHGRMRPLSFASTKLQIAPQSPVLGVQFSQAVGCALGIKLAGKEEAVYVSAGEGACTLGEFHEALSWAARETLPVVFVVQSNSRIWSTEAAEDLPEGGVLRLGAAYPGLECAAVDGTDLQACLETVRKAHDRARKGKGPTLIEASVPRLQGHFAGEDQRRYRSEGELRREAKRCPLAALKAVLLRRNFAGRSDLNRLEREAAARVHAAIAWADGQADPRAADAASSVFVQTTLPEEHADEETKGEMGLREAVVRALQEELRRNQKLLLLGHDLPGGYGASGVSGTLAERFAPRLIHAPLSAGTAIGAAAGLARQGFRTVVEVPGVAALRRAYSQLHAAAATCYATRGDFTCPLVIRLITGRLDVEQVQHVEALAAHIPGLIVLYPSNAADAKGLFKSALLLDAPVLFIEHAGLSEAPQARSEIGGDKTRTAIGKAKIVRTGSDLTLVAWGAEVPAAVAAAERVSAEGISTEVIDLRTIAPLDIETISNSIRKTARALIVHEDVQDMGFGAEIAARIAEQCFEQLDAPLRRVAGKSVPFTPFARDLACAAAPREQDILAAIRSIATY